VMINVRVARGESKHLVAQVRNLSRITADRSRSERQLLVRHAIRI